MVGKKKTRLTGRFPPEDELDFFDDRDSKLECSLGEEACNTHFETTVHCTGGLVESWYSSDMYENVASTNGGVYSLDWGIGPGGIRSRRVN